MTTILPHFHSRAETILSALNTVDNYASPIISCSDNQCELMWWPATVVLIRRDGRIMCYSGPQLEPHVIIPSETTDLSKLVEWAKSVIPQAINIVDE